MAFFLCALISFVLYYLALPPVECWPLIFLVPFFWIPLIGMRTEDCPKHPYRILFFLTVAFWGVTLIWLPLPHWGIWFGWVAISFGLAPWVTLVTAAARTLVHRVHPACILFLPLLWIGGEWFRFHVLDGFSFCALQHALYQQPAWQQSSWLFGEYSVAGILVLAGALAGLALWPAKFGGIRRRDLGGMTLRALSLLCAAGILLGTYYSGSRAIARWDGEQKARAAESDRLRVLLMQDGESITYPVSHEAEFAIHKRYVEQTEKALARLKAEGQNDHPVDLVIWPEGTFALPFFDYLEGAYLPEMENLSAEQRAGQMESILAAQRQEFDAWIKKLGVPVLVGGMMYEYAPNFKMNVYNTAILQDTGGRRQRYDKVQRVLVGEYIPLLDRLPDSFPLKTLCTPIAAGTRDGLFDISGIPVLVSICFESSLPHLYFDKIKSMSRSPEFMLNISNDGWFRGGTENPIHQATYVFRAIENRRFLLAAVHGNASLAIDPVGRIFAIGPRCQTGEVLVDFVPRAPEPLGKFGMWIRLFPALCALLLAAMWPINRLLRRRTRDGSKNSVSEGSSDGSESASQTAESTSAPA
ncbi:MAG: apolipoprotein N-acyltransferase [Thermoguttaceae bacterium]|nr:apolipoprotein N-acyltransferase [Thermoguttaceae bacterium]